jgi:hypothetical protein
VICSKEEFREKFSQESRVRALCAGVEAKSTVKMKPFSPQWEDRSFVNMFRGEHLNQALDRRVATLGASTLHQTLKRNLFRHIFTSKSYRHLLFFNMAENMQKHEFVTYCIFPTLNGESSSHTSCEDRDS